MAKQECDLHQSVFGKFATQQCLAAQSKHRDADGRHGRWEMQWKVKVCIGPWLKIASDFIWLLMGSGWTDILCVYVYIYIYHMMYMTYVPILIVGFSFWCVWAMAMLPPVCLIWNQKFIVFYFLTSWLQIPKQKMLSHMFFNFYGIVFYFQSSGQVTKKILNLNYIYTWMFQGSEQMGYNLYPTYKWGIYWGEITHWSDHLWSIHFQRDIQVRGPDDSLTKTPVGVDGKTTELTDSWSPNHWSSSHTSDRAAYALEDPAVFVRMAFIHGSKAQKTHKKSKRIFFSGEKKVVLKKKCAANFWTDIFRRSIHRKQKNTHHHLSVLKIPVPWCVPSKDAQRQISKLVAHLITDITRSLAASLS